MSVDKQSCPGMQCTMNVNMFVIDGPLHYVKWIRLNTNLDDT